jgi:hypothetical protein
MFKNFFTDTANHWSSSYVMSLYEEGALKKKDSFYPDNNINRVEFTKMVLESLDL